MTTERPTVERPTVLVVDDRPENLLTVEAVLERLDVHIEKALRADAALQFLLETDAAVILMDVEMPGMDGFETARLIRERPRSHETPIIFITAVDRGDEAMRAGYELGAVDYIVKPFHPNILRWKVSVFAELYRNRQRERLLLEEQIRRSEAEGAAIRFRILADIGKTLASAIDEPIALSAVARHCVPDLADFVAVFIRENDQKFRLDSLIGPHDVDLASVSELEYHAQDPLFGVIRNSDTVKMVSFNERSSERLLGHAHRSLAERLNVRSGLFLPIGSSPMHAVIAFYRQALNGFGSIDAVFATELKGRVEAAFANRELYAQSQRSNRAKDEFLAIVSHELRTPLVTISGWANVLISKKMPPEAFETALRAIQRSAKFQTALISDILDFSQIATGNFSAEFQDLDLKSVLEQTIVDMRPLAEEKHIEMDVDIGDALITIKGDAHRLQQVFSNLLGNAIKFTHEAGRISVTATADEQSISVAITDTGIGIEPAFLSQVFEPFLQADSSNTRRYGGLGLGLAIAQRLIKLHGGRIQVQSQGRGKGATFLTILPIARARRLAS